MRLALKRLRFHFTAGKGQRFPTPASNVLRGALGDRLWSRKDGSFDQFFAPRSAGGPSGLADPPRPFVVRAHHLDSRSITPGEAFWFDLHVFDLRRDWTPVLHEALQSVSGAALQRVDEERVELRLDDAASAVSQVHLRFVTPTELKHQGKVVREPDFGVLMARVRDRVAGLAELYGDGPLAVDFAAMGERAARVRMTCLEVEQVEASRRSGRTGQVHGLGGFTGQADYEGDLAEFVPLLRAAEWTGVGRQTVWGKGALQIGRAPE